MIERPKQVQRAFKNYLSNEQYQQYSEEQFNNIYDAIEDDETAIMNLEIEASEIGDMYALTNMEIENLLR